MEIYKTFPVELQRLIILNLNGDEHLKLCDVMKTTVCNKNDTAWVDRAYRDFGPAFKNNRETYITMKNLKNKINSKDFYNMFGVPIGVRDFSFKDTYRYYINDEDYLQNYIDDRDRDGYTIINYAASINDMVGVQKLLKYNPNIRIFNKYGETPLTYSIKNNDANMASLFIDNGADVDMDSRNTPLMNAVINENFKLISLLLDAGANVNVTNKYGHSPLSLSLKDYRKHREIFEYLLSRGANINLKDSDGNTILFNEDPTKTSLLIEHGADPNIQNNKGLTPLMVCISKGGTWYTCELLITKENINLQDNAGNTALMYAAAYQPKIVKDLLKKGANKAIKNNKGETAYDFASDTHVQELLKRYNPKSMTRFFY